MVLRSCAIYRAMKALHKTFQRDKSRSYAALTFHTSISYTRYERRSLLKAPPMVTDFILHGTC
jgi:hypothetical protein